MNLTGIQAALREAKLDGWLFYDHHRRDPIAYRVLNINPVMCTRRWYYLIPSAGEPAKLVHRIEAHNLADLPGTEERYSSWREQREGLARCSRESTAWPCNTPPLTTSLMSAWWTRARWSWSKAAGWKWSLRRTWCSSLRRAGRRSNGSRTWLPAGWCTSRCGRRSRLFAKRWAPASRSANSTSSRK